MSERLLVKSSKFTDASFAIIKFKLYDWRKSFISSWSNEHRYNTAITGKTYYDHPLLRQLDLLRPLTKNPVQLLLRPLGFTNPSNEILKHSFIQLLRSTFYNK